MADSLYSAVYGIRPKTLGYLGRRDLRGEMCDVIEIVTDVDEDPRLIKALRAAGVRL